MRSASASTSPSRSSAGPPRWSSNTTRSKRAAAKPSDEGEVRFRLLRADDTPATNPLNDPFVFGLQDTKGNLTPGVRRADGMLVWAFSLRVKPGPVPERPVFLGPCASGSAGDRFVYLSWLSIPRAVFINRLKCRLNTVTWDLVHAAQTADRPIEADVSGRGPAQAMKPVGWRLGS